MCVASRHGKLKARADLASDELDACATTLAPSVLARTVFNLWCLLRAARSAIAGPRCEGDSHELGGLRPPAEDLCASPSRQCVAAVEIAMSEPSAIACHTYTPVLHRLRAPQLAVYSGWHGPFRWPWQGKGAVHFPGDTAADWSSYLVPCVATAFPVYLTAGPGVYDLFKGEL